MFCLQTRHAVKQQPVVGWLGDWFANLTVTLGKALTKEKNGLCRVPGTYEKCENSRSGLNKFHS